MASLGTNEEIIENLTKDFENSNVEDKETLKSRSEESITNNHEHQSNDDDDDDATKIQNEKQIHEDEIDEISLKDRDSLLSEEDKQNFLKEALNCKNEGNNFFKAGDYFESIASYTKGLKLCPLEYSNDRSILYANRAASKQKLARKESAIQDCSKAIELNGNYIKAYLRRAMLYEETEKLDESLEDYKKILEFDSNNKEAIGATMRLPNLINERNEKLKAEMMDKLKDLGNMVLRPFGLSTNNFQMTKDPSSGGYSINFVQNR